MPQYWSNEVHDNLVEALKTGEDAALVLIDQSKAFDIINHKILLEKLSIISFWPQAIQIMLSFLEERRQYVQIQAAESECLLTGPRSVIQGSTLSGILYLIYMLDLPYLTHKTIHKPKEYRKCKKPNIKTFVDDCIVKVDKSEDTPIEDDIRNLMSKIEDYALANKLAINQGKTKVVVISRNKEIKEKFSIILNGKEIKHSKEVEILGIKVADDLMWDRHIQTNLIPQIANRVRTYAAIAKYLGPQFRQIYANSCYRSKLLFGIKSWGGAQKVTINKLQSFQDKMTKIALGKEGWRLSTNIKRNRDGCGKDDF